MRRRAPFVVAFLGTASFACAALLGLDDESYPPFVDASSGDASSSDARAGDDHANVDAAVDARDAAADAEIDGDAADEAAAPGFCARQRDAQVCLDFDEDASFAQLGWEQIVSACADCILALQSSDSVSAPNALLASTGGVNGGVIARLEYAFAGSSTGASASAAIKLTETDEDSGSAAQVLTLRFGTDNDYKLVAVAKNPTRTSIAEQVAVDGSTSFVDFTDLGNVLVRGTWARVTLEVTTAADSGVAEAKVFIDGGLAGRRTLGGAWEGQPRCMVGVVFTGSDRKWALHVDDVLVWR
jgi:hypothetical protein